MKKLLLLLMAMSWASLSYSQDYLIKKDGTDIKAKVLEIGDDSIKYRKWDNLEGPVYVINAAEILMIRYENGTNEVIYKESNSANTSRKGVERSSKSSKESKIMLSDEYFWTSDISILESEKELRYNDLKKFYDKKYYSDLKNPRYSPARAWLSFLIPGLAQYTMKEPGLGTLHLLMSYVVGGGLMATGAGLAATSTYSVYVPSTSRYSPGYYQPRVDSGKQIAGIVLSCTGAALFLAFDIASICNAVNIAKVKSLYYDDLEDYKKVNAPVSVKFAPYLDYAYTSSGYKICPSLGLRLTF